MSKTAKIAVSVMPLKQGSARVKFEPFLTFLMRGIGYGHPEWRHGGYKGDLAVARAKIEGALVVLASATWVARKSKRICASCRACWPS